MTNERDGERVISQTRHELIKSYHPCDNLFTIYMYQHVCKSTNANSLAAFKNYMLKGPSFSIEHSIAVSRQWCVVYKTTCSINVNKSHIN